MTEHATDPQNGDAALSPQTDAAAEDPAAPADTVETLDREYVQKLRDEAAGHRVKAERTDALNARLATAQAA